MCCHMPCANTLSFGGRGGRRMRPRSAGSTASARPGSPSVTRFTHRMWIGSSGIGRPRKGARKMVQDLAQVAGHGVADELADVVVDAPALAHGGDDRGEVVVEQDQVRGLARHVGAGAAHRDADVRAAAAPARRSRRRRSSRRPRRAPAAPPRSGSSARGSRARRRPSAPARSRSSSGDRRASSAPSITASLLAQDAQRLRDGARRHRVVAGDHDRPDAGRHALGHRRRGLLARRVDETHEPEEVESCLHLVDRPPRTAVRPSGATPTASTRSPSAAMRSASASARRPVDRRLALRRGHARAPRHQGLGRALGEGEVALRRRGAPSSCACGPSRRAAP